MHVQGVIERRADGAWVGVDDLPYLPPAARPPVFGRPAADTAGSGEDRDAVAAARGLQSHEVTADIERQGLHQFAKGIPITMPIEKPECSSEERTAQSGEPGTD